MAKHHKRTFKEAILDDGTKPFDWRLRLTSSDRCAMSEGKFTIRCKKFLRNPLLARKQCVLEAPVVLVYCLVTFLHNDSMRLRSVTQ